MSEETVAVTVPAVAININQTYDPAMSAEELYDFTRGVWRLDRDRADSARYAFAVYRGKIIEVYQIQKWYRAGRTEYVTGRTFSDKELETRFEFVGRVATDEVRNRFRGKHLSDSHAQNPIKYFKC